MNAPSRPLNLLIAGEEAAGLQLLQALHRTHHRIVGVLASPAGVPSGSPSVWQAAREMGHVTWPADFVRRSDFAEAIRAAGVDVMLNAHSLHLVCQAVLDAPRYGAFNLHPGPLPRYAGLNAPSWAIFQGETRHGVTVHRMAARIDAGPVAYRAEFPIEAKDTALALYVKCTRLGVPLMLKVVEALSEDPDSLPAEPLTDVGRRYYGLKPPNGGWVAWDWPAATIAAFGRACDFGPFPSPWARPMASLGDQVIGLAKMALTGEAASAPPGTVGRVDGRGARVACIDEDILVTLVTSGGQRLPAASILTPGDRLFGSPLSTVAA